MRRIHLSIYTIFWLILAYATTSLAQTGRWFDVRDFGATGLKRDTVTQSIQQAIDICAQTGGGTVYFPPGEYLSGTVQLKSRVRLHLESGATWYASQDSNDYKVDYPIYKNSNPQHSVLIYAQAATQIAITGKGIIDGQARREYRPLSGIDSFVEEETQNTISTIGEVRRYYKIPPNVGLVYLVDCKDVTVKDITLRESVDWTLHVQWCDNVFITRTTIYSDLEQGVNADGIDIDGSRNVIISDCLIETGDDAIVLKTTRTNNRSEPCENVTVTNCVLTSTSAALKIGTETYNDFRYINFSNSVIRNTNRGLSIIVRDGGTVSDVQFSNISMELGRKPCCWWGGGDPIWLVILKRNEASEAGAIRRVRFSNVQAQAQGTSKIENRVGGLIEDIHLSHVSLNMLPESEPDKRASDALQINNVRGITIDHLQVRWDRENPEDRWQSALRVTDSQHLLLTHFRGLQGLYRASDPVIVLNNVKYANIVDAQPTGNTSALIRVRGNETRNVNLNNLDRFQWSQQKVAISPEVPLEEISLK